MQRLRVQPLAPGEGQQLRGQPVGASGSPRGRLDERQRGGVVPQLAPEHLQVAVDDRQHVVEVVRDAAGQLADGLHLLGLHEAFLGRTQRPLGLPAPGDVGEDAEDTERAALAVAFQAGRQQHVDEGAVLLAEDALDLAQLAAAEQDRQALGQPVRRLRQAEIMQRASDHVLARVAEQVAPVVADPVQPAPDVHRVQRHRRVLVDAAMTRLAFLQEMARAVVFQDTQRELAIGALQVRRRRNRERPGQQRPEDDGGGHGQRCRDRLDDALGPVCRHPERQHRQPVRRAAGEDASGEQGDQPLEGEVAAPVDEPRHRHRDRGVGQRDDGVRSGLQDDQAGMAVQAEAVRREAGRTVQAAQGIYVRLFRSYYVRAVAYMPTT